MEEKKYVNGMIIKEKVFDNGGTQLKLNIKTDDFIAQLKEMSENGWVNLIVSRRKEPSDTGITHYAYQDTWKPTKQKTTNKVVEIGADDLPF
jgi:DNA topoisomerase IA